MSVWKKLNRKERQFKHGDIVRSTQEEYMEVRKVADTEKTFLCMNHTSRKGLFRYNRFQVELICPVEWRADLMEEEQK